MFIVKELRDTWVQIAEFKTLEEARQFKLGYKRKSGNPTRIYHDEKEVF